MSNLIKVTDNYSISEEQFNQLKDTMKQYFDELYPIVLASGIVTKGDMSEEAVQAASLIFANSIVEGAIESYDESVIFDEDRLNDYEKEMARNEMKQILAQFIL